VAIGIFSNQQLITIIDVPVDGRESELHTLTAEASKFALEDGSQVSDHIVINPAEIEIPYVLTNLDGEAGSYGQRAATAYNEFRRKLNSRELYDVVTRHVLYENMALLETPAENTAPFSGRLFGSLKFQQINMANVASVEYPPSQFPNDGTRTSAMSEVQSGNQASSGLDDVTAIEIAEATWGS
jgi:hypothetical protein